ncbi:hypothetical protein BDF20DRAFT_908095 [Mycotypha africana]|uniref:uncharacterized protein n=1 Tax=Mycotypha africana TaxID=64632 RepID=UPI002300379A|nr:uncharacterized protein BDF20DRAFT_908095 [Mycotypha africana]KAI8968389.1 hypothetical protein BDF20DRAFT_908095 [Mycotypha africana]
MPEDLQQKPIQRWVPLEANPEIIHELGVDSRYNYVDVLEAYEKFSAEEEAHLARHEQNISPDVVFFKQTIGNACGMIALLHSLANNDDEIIGPGLFNDIIEKAKDMSVEERVELLENCEKLAQVHETAAGEGQTEAPDKNDSINLHFVCFVEVDQHLYELDGRKLFPINHGKCTNLVEGAAKVMKQFMAREPDENNFSAIAFCKTAE